MGRLQGDRAECDMQQEMIKDQAKSEEVSKGYVLVVDDDEFSRDLVSRRIQRAGYMVTTTGDGRKVPDLLARHEFNLVLLDLVMPTIGGREVLASIRTEHSLYELPVIMVTSNTDGDEIAECFRGGANDYVTKPFETQ
ncbi:MAG: response regulator, partial [Alphaproteobacteria bacterium]|nr:response regulator [Alphaproteobacteria bacterium]